MAAHHLYRSIAKYSAQGEGHAVGFASDHSNPNASRHALEVFVKLTAGGLAGSDAGDLPDLIDVTRPLPEGIAAGLEGPALPG